MILGVEKTMRNFERRLKQVLNSIIVFLFGSIVMVTILQVFFRYCLNVPLMWTEELARYLFIWGILIASARGLEEGLHIGIEIVLDKQSDKVRAIIKFFIYSIMIIFLVFVIYYGWVLVGKVITTKSPALHLPMSIVYLALPFSSIIWIIIILKEMLKTYSLIK